nr:zinc finger, CCHC-type [Tanacetum cinerariifolium]
DEKRVWFEVKLQGAQGDREAEVFQVSNNDTAVTQRRLEDEQPEEKTNADYLVKEQEKESDWVEDLDINMGFNESGEYKKTFIGSGVEPHRNVDHVFGSQEVQTQDLIYYHSSRDKEQHSAWELFSYREDSNEAAFAVAAVKKINAHDSFTFNNTFACKDEIWVTKGLLVKAKGNVLGLEIIRDQGGNTLKVSQSRIQTLLKGHSTLSLEDSLLGDYDVK